jgi:hypothetical protein
LFERGGCTKNDFKTAIELYGCDRSNLSSPSGIQRAMALLVTRIASLRRSRVSSRRGIAAGMGFASKFGTMLGSYFTDPQAAEPILRRALELNAGDVDALIVLARSACRRRYCGSLTLIKKATSPPRRTLPRGASGPSLNLQMETKPRPRPA